MNAAIRLWLGDALTYLWTLRCARIFRDELNTKFAFAWEMAVTCADTQEYVNGARCQPGTLSWDSPAEAAWEELDHWND